MSLPFFSDRRILRLLDPQSLSRHTDRLFRAAWGLCGSREDAEDLVQETFARVLAKPRTISGEDELRYLMRVLRNTYFTSRRTASRRPVTVAAIEEVTLADARRTSQPALALEISEIYEAIATLPEDFRLALVAVDLLGLSYREAAKALRVREATVTTRLYRARRRLASTLGDSVPASQNDGSAEIAAEPRPNRLATPVRREGSSPQESLLKRSMQ